MIVETRQSRTSLLHTSERNSRRRRHHTLDNATLDKFNFICVPLHLDETRTDASLSKSNFIFPSSSPKLTELVSPTRRVRFKLDENQHTHSSDDVQLPKKYSIHRVEFQIPIQKNTNTNVTLNCSSTSPKIRSITSKKIDINHNNSMHQQGMSSFIDFPTLSTVDSDKTQTQWYKEMYGQLHKSPETKKDGQKNPYQPTYTFPKELDGDLERMEDYIRKAAAENIDDDGDKNISSSPVRVSTINVKDRQTIPKRTNFDEKLSSPITSSSIERTKLNNDDLTSSITINSRSHPTNIRTPSVTSDDEQKIIYKRILRGGDIPSTGLQKYSVNNRVSSSSVQRPLILTNHPKLFAYYSVHWEQIQTNNHINDDMHLEINSCLYFQNNNNIDDNEWEQTREDGCGYVITYPPHIRPTDNLQIYNFDRTKDIVSNTTPTSPTGSTRTYTSPLMGTSARAAKRRIDSDSGPVRIEGTDIHNQQLQHHYQNVRQILEDQQQLPSSNIDPSLHSQQSFSAKRDFFEQRFKTQPATYDTPPRQQGQNTITSTATTISSNLQDRTSSSSNESPSVDRLLEQAVELQKMSNINSVKQDSQLPYIIERTEQYQVFLDSSNHEVRRTPSISRTSLIPITKIGYATDLDQAQAQVERLTDDHQAIQHLTRALQDHNVTTINEYKRFPSQTNQTSSSLSPSSGVLLQKTNLPLKSEYSVIDALLNNPIGTDDEKDNYLLNVRSYDISKNLRNPEYLNSLKQPVQVSTKSNKKQPKEKKPKEKKVKEKKSKEKSSGTTDTVKHAAAAVATPLTKTPETQTTQQITTTKILSEQTPLIDPKEKKKQDKENKKQAKIKAKKESKTKPKKKSKDEDYQVIDALISSPITTRLPDSYRVKYNVSAPLTQSSPLQSIPPPIPSNTVVTTTTTTTSKDKHTPATDKNQTLYHLAKIVYDLQEHHKAALRATQNIPIQSKETVVTIKQSEPLVKGSIYQQQPILSSRQTEIRPQSEPVKPRVYYRYMDEQGRVLKFSPVPPSELREEPSQYICRNTEPPHLYGRHIAIDDDRRHPLSQYEQRATWQGEPKLPTTVTREDLELQDKRVPQLIEQSIPTTRTVPTSVDHERSSRNSSQQQSRTYNSPNQQNVKLAWLPLSCPAEQQYLVSGGAGYDTDSTISERSATFRPREYVPSEHHYRYPNGPINYDYYTCSPGPYYNPAPPVLSHSGRGISPEYGNGGASRNYIEVFRGGDFRETKPSEIYSLPLNEHIRTSPMLPTNSRHSRYDQYQSERYGTISNHQHIPSTPPKRTPYYYANTLPNARYQNTISPTTVHTSAYYTHRNPYSHHTVERSPNPEYTTYIRPSKSFDYRPLRTKLQREYKITPNLLVDEWDYPQVSDNIKNSPSTTNRSGVSSPDDVFINNQTTNKA